MKTLLVVSTFTTVHCARPSKTASGERTIGVEKRMYHIVSIFISSNCSFQSKINRNII